MNNYSLIAYIVTTVSVTQMKQKLNEHNHYNRRGGV